MRQEQIEDLNISLDCTGSWEYAKVSYPVRYGLFAQIENKEYIFRFSPGGEIKYIQGRGPDWPRNEWLKRTPANDWVYYSAEGYNSIFSLTGEYYLPCFSYTDNSVSVVNPFKLSAVKNAVDSVGHLSARITRLLEGHLPPDVKKFFAHAARNDAESLAGRSDDFHAILGGPVSVLPPDTRHVDYEVIPLIIADGCLYNCGFCSVKTGKGFSVRSRENITGQIGALKEFYGPDIVNHNSIFIGQHDAIQAGAGMIEFVAEESYEAFRLGSSFMKGANLFIFGSVGSFLSATENLFEILDVMPYRTFINIGLESADQNSLDILNKPVSAAKVRDAFIRMNEINLKYERIEVTANFVLGPVLPENHSDSIIKLVSGLGRHTEKGAIYLSPLDGGEAVREIRRQIYNIKNYSRVPVYLYLIQRL